MDRERQTRGEEEIIAWRKNIRDEPSSSSWGAFSFSYCLSVGAMGDVFPECAVVRFLSNARSGLFCVLMSLHFKSYCVKSFASISLRYGILTRCERWEANTSAINPHGGQWEFSSPDLSNVMISHDLSPLITPFNLLAQSTYSLQSTYEQATISRETLHLIASYQYGIHQFQTHLLSNRIDSSFVKNHSRSRNVSRCSI